MSTAARLLLFAGVIAAPVAGQIVRITDDPARDIKPSLQHNTALCFGIVVTWQTDRSGNWDIYSAFAGSPTPVPVCRDSADDCNPFLLGDDRTDGGWCFWERRTSPVTGEVWCAGHDWGLQWSAPLLLGRSVNTDGDSAWPAATLCDYGQCAGQWVAWTNHDTAGSYVLYTFRNGDSWTTPRTAVASARAIRRARLGVMSFDTDSVRPLLVWGEADSVFCSAYRAGVWSTPLPVAPGPGVAGNPDVVGAREGTIVVWESTREGDTAIYGTLPDSFAVALRLCDTLGRNTTPVGVFSTAWNTPEVGLIAFVSDRRGAPDVYLGSDWGGDQLVDPRPGPKLHPTVASVSTAGGPNYSWVAWQADLDGNWDIYALFLPGPGINEGSPTAASGSRPAATLVRTVLTLPSAFCNLTSDFVLHDAAGRRVQTLRPGPNDVSSLAPGVYFVRAASGITRTVIAR